LNEYAYWLDTVGTENPVDEVAEAAIDVAIIGAGYTGLAAARQLARSGASILVLDRGGVGWGASSRNSGQVLTGLKLDPGTLVARYGEGAARRLFDASLESIASLETLIAEESIDCQYERTGHLQAASKPRHFDALRAEQALLARTFNHRVDLISRTEQRRELGSDAYHGLLLDERSGALNPARYVHGLAAAARRAGARIATGVAVTRIERRASGGSSSWSLTTEAIGSPRSPVILARDLLVATNGYTDRAAPALQRRLVPIGSYSIVTEPLAPGQASAILPRRRMAFDTKNFLYYFRLTADRRLLFGGRAEFSPPTPDSTRRSAAILRSGMSRIFPDLASARIDYAWGGNVACSRDQLPHAGRLDDLYYAGGYCGHGIAMATHLGELVARFLAGQKIDHPLLGRPAPTIPFYRGTAWFLPVVAAYYRLQDLIA
jgi:glycine/D-amino acid oxidase-like deaminating enzyme